MRTETMRKLFRFIMIFHRKKARSTRRDRWLTRRKAGIAEVYQEWIFLLPGPPCQLFLKIVRTSSVLKSSGILKTKDSSGQAVISCGHFRGRGRLILEKGSPLRHQDTKVHEASFVQLRDFEP